MVPNHDRPRGSEALFVAVVAAHRVGVDAKGEARVGVAELGHDVGRVLAADIEDRGEGVAELVSRDAVRERGVAAAGEQLLRGGDDRPDDALAGVVLVAA